jgi:hypothetical protein
MESNVVSRAHTAHALARPALVLLTLLVEQADTQGRATLPESWVAHEVGCCPARLRRYRADLNRTGLVHVRKYGQFLEVQVAPAAPGHVAAERAESVTLPLLAAVQAAEERAESVTLDDAAEGSAREKCDAQPGERAKSVTLAAQSGPEAREKCDAQPAERAKSVTLDDANPSRAREKCDASCPCDTVPVDGGLVGSVNLINQVNHQPTNQTHARTRDAQSASAAAEGLVWVVGPEPENPDDARKRRLLTDPAVGLDKTDLVDLFVRAYPWEELLRQVFACEHDIARRAHTADPVVSPGGWLANRLRKHLADETAYRAGALTREDRASELYRRHVVWGVAPADEPDEADEPDVHDEAGPTAGDDESSDGALDARPSQPAGAARGAEPAGQPLTAADLWQVARDQLRAQMSQEAWHSWVRDAELLDCTEDTFRVAVPNEQARDWLRLRMRGVIERTLAGMLGRPARAEFVLASTPAEVAYGG